MTELPWLSALTEDFSYLVKNLPTTTLLLDTQRGNAIVAAKSIAAAALCLNPHNGQACQACQSCHLLKQDTHPDLIWRDDPCKVDDVRTLTEQSQKTPNIAKRRIIFLPDIDRYNDYALNALLKTLEEPPASNHFILSAPNRRAVKPTILSRARCLSVPTPNHNQALNWLCHTHQWSVQDATRALALCQDNPFRVLTQRDIPDPAAEIALCVMFLTSPKHETAYLMHLDGLDQNHLVDYVCAQLIALINYIQLDSYDEYWQNHLASIQAQIKALDLPKLHTLYARISALRQPQVQQVGMAANIKGHLLEIMDNRIPIL
ncbi:DNA polymerase III subunit delta' [Cardiobacteriaceae bacterium TAE3-ERU3]|nr:DNA polymerase III subunit delta' [Cardiobacteriaceae bacterium TAE3-ERU3]